MKDLLELEKAMQVAEWAMEEEVERRWPVGCTIRVRLNCRQVNLTEMTVQGHRGQGYVNAWMERKSYYRRSRFVKNVYFKDIEGWDKL